MLWCPSFFDLWATCVLFMVFMALYIPRSPFPDPIDKLFHTFPFIIEHMRKNSFLSTIVIGATIGGIFFLLVAFTLSQMGHTLASDRQIKSTLTFIFFDAPTVLLRYPAQLVGYNFSPGLLFILTFFLYAFFGACINFILSLLRSRPF